MCDCRCITPSTTPRLSHWDTRAMSKARPGVPSLLNILNIATPQAFVPFFQKKNGYAGVSGSKGSVGDLATMRFFCIFRYIFLCL